MLIGYRYEPYIPDHGLPLEPGDLIEFRGERFIVHQQQRRWGQGRASDTLENVNLVLLLESDHNDRRDVKVYSNWYLRETHQSLPLFECAILEAGAYKQVWVKNQ